MRRLAVALPLLLAGVVLITTPGPADALVRPVDVIVHFGGLGSGRVTSDPAAMDCTSDCTVQFEWLQQISLTAEPQNGGTFGGWQDGPCGGSSNPVCSFQVPATFAEMTVVFDPIGPPISAPPNPTPSPTPPLLTPPPTPQPSRPRPTDGPAPTIVAPTDVIASDGTVTTPPSTLPPGVTPAPTIVGLDQGDATDAGSSGGISLPIVIVLILLLGGVVGGGVYWFTKRQQAAGP